MVVGTHPMFPIQNSAPTSAVIEASKVLVFNVIEAEMRGWNFGRKSKLTKILQIKLLFDYQFKFCCYFRVPRGWFALCSFHFGLKFQSLIFGLYYIKANILEASRSAVGPKAQKMNEMVQLTSRFWLFEFPAFCQPLLQNRFRFRVATRLK